MLANIDGPGEAMFAITTMFIAVGVVCAEGHVNRFPSDRRMM